MIDRLVGWLHGYGVSGEAVFGTIVVLIGILAVNRTLQRLLLGIQPRIPLPSDTVLLFTRALSSVLWLCAGLLILEVWGVSVSGLARAAGGGFAAALEDLEQVLLVAFGDAEDLLEEKGYWEPGAVVLPMTTSAALVRPPFDQAARTFCAAAAGGR